MNQSLDNYLAQLDDVIPERSKIQAGPSPQKTSISGQELIILLTEHGPLTNADICDKAGMDKTSMSHKQSVRAAAQSQRRISAIYYDPDTMTYGINSEENRSRFVEFNNPAIDLLDRMINVLKTLKSDDNDIRLLRIIRDKIKSEI